MLIARAWVGDRIYYGEVEQDQFHGLVGDPYVEQRHAGWSVPVADLTLLSPCDARRVFVVIGGFLPADGSPLPEGTVPILMPKITSHVSGQDGQVVCPSWLTSNVVAEGEMAVVIRKELHNASPEEAQDGILGFTCFNDVTAMEFFIPTSIAGKDLFRAKSIETFASMGPFIRTDVEPAEIEQGMGIYTRVNGEQRQNGTTKIYRFSPAVTISSLSTYITFLPGDVISLGTPPPAAEIKPGDVVEVEVEGIGVLRNHVVDSSNGTAFDQSSGKAVTR